MLSKQDLQFINVFVNNQLKNTQWTNVIDTRENIDLILEQIKSYPQFKNFKKAQILQQLIIDTSYNSQQLCFTLFSLYNHKYCSVNTLFNAWDVLYRLSLYTINHDQYIYDIMYIYCVYIGHATDLETMNRILTVSEEERQREKDNKYTLLRGMEKNNYSDEYKIKWIFIFFQKIFNMLRKPAQNKSLISEVLMFIHQYYISEFNFSLKDRKLFVNIIVKMFIQSFIFQKSTTDYFSKASKRWDVFLSFIFSNWSLLHNDYQQFIKANGKEIIQCYYGYQETPIERQEKAKQKFEKLIDELN